MIQAESLGGHPRPIIVRHRFGEQNFRDSVRQVYWFTRIFTSNLYSPTAIPATTEIANNIAGTSSKIHKPSYLG